MKDHTVNKINTIEVSSKLGVQKIVCVPLEVYSRVCGYYRPVSQWNKGKKEEFR